MDGGLTAGLHFVSGDACVLMTADLQDPPEAIPDFLRHWEQGYENVYGEVVEREGTGPLRKFNSWLFYKIAAALTGGLVVKNASDFRLVDRRVYEAVREMDERNRFVRGLFAWVGFSSVGVPVPRPPRFAGESKAYFLPVLNFAIKGIFSHSYLPLRFITVLGFMMSTFSIIFLAWVGWRAIAYGVPFEGYGTILGVLLLGFGFLSAVIGLVGEYIALIYEEVKRRPNFVVRKTVGLQERR
jgi:dolichol-phosphate mannosyltransferase